jgi:hypothetical protein
MLSWISSTFRDRVAARIYLGSKSRIGEEWIWISRSIAALALLMAAPYALRAPSSRIGDRD